MTEGETFTITAAKLNGTNFIPIPYTIQPLTYSQAEERGVNLDVLFPARPRSAASGMLGMLGYKPSEFSHLRLLVTLSVKFKIDILTIKPLTRIAHL